MDEFLKSVRTTQETIEVYQKVQNTLSKNGANLNNWITGEEGFKKSKIPEADKWTKNV